MQNDPIIMEVRRIREELAREGDFDLERIFKQEAEEFKAKWAGEFKMATEQDLMEPAGMPLANW